eukprot:6482168-Amphidinium_carterae.1
MPRSFDAVALGVCPSCSVRRRWTRQALGLRLQQSLRAEDIAKDSLESPLSAAPRRPQFLRYGPPLE